MTSLTPAQKDFIKKNFLEFTDKELARFLAVDKRVVQKTLKSLGLFRHKQQKKQILSRRTFQNNQEFFERPFLKLISILALIVLGVITYANSFKNEFVWDDEFLITRNYLIKSFSYLPLLFKTTLWSGVGLPTNGYRPLQMLTNMIDFSIWKFNAFGFHLTNALFHIAAAVLMYLVALKIIRLNEEKLYSAPDAKTALYRNLFAFFVSSLFLVHPLQTEAVTYISGRADPLSLFFMLGSFLFFIKYLTELKRSFIYYLAALLFFALALFSKEASLILPFLLISFVISFYSERFPSKWSVAASFLGFFIIMIAFMGVRNAVVGDLVDKDIFRKQAMQMALGSDGNPSLYLRLLTSAIAFAIYLRLLFLPAGLHMEWRLEQARGILEPNVIAAVLFFVLFLCLILISKKRQKIIAFFGMSWFLIALIPASNIMPLNAAISEHWLYIPSFGIFLIVASFIIWAIRAADKKILKAFVLIFMLAVISVFSFLSIRRNMDWKNTLTIHMATLKYSPNSTRALNNVAKFHQENGDFKKAKEYYRKALDVDPNYVESLNNLGVIFLRENNLDEAERYFMGALKNRSYSPSTRNNLGILYIRKQQYDKALNEFYEALKVNPKQAISWANIGDTNRALGKKDEAERNYKKAIESEAGYTYAYNQLAALYISQGKKEEAKEIINTAKRLNLQGIVDYKIE